MLDTIFPLLRPIDASPLPDRPGEFKVTLGDAEDTPPWVTTHNRALVLGGSALKLAHEFDGQRSCAAIAAQLKAAGIGLPSDDVVLAVAQSLERAGLVRLGRSPWSEAAPEPPKELISVNPLRHRCLGCGRGCQGHMIGPLEQPFLDRLPEIMETLGAIYPDVAALDEATVPMETKPDARRLRLNEDKICVFLGEDRLCRIHKQMGSQAKPLICRTFPVQIVETEGELRVGVTRCFEAHHSYNDGSPEQTPSEITGLDPSEPMALDKRGLNPADRLHLKPPVISGTVAARHAALEQRLMTLLEPPDATVELLLRFALEVTTGRALPSDHVGMLARPAVAAALSEALGAFASEAYQNAKASLDRSAPWTKHAIYRSLLLTLIGGDARAFTGLTPGQRHYGMHVLREWFFLRSWYNHASFEISALAMAIGLVVAHWCAEDEGVEDPDKPGDAFAWPLTAWTRMMSHPSTLGLFMGDGRHEALVQALMAALSEDTSDDGNTADA